MANGYARIAWESIPGNETNSPTLSTKKIFPPLIGLNLKQGVAHLERDDELRNIDEPIQVVPEAYSPEWELECRAYPDVLAAMLKTICGAPVTRTGDGIITDPDAVIIPAGAYEHKFTAPYGPSGVSPLTAQLDVAYSQHSTYFKAKGAACEKLEIESPETGGVQIKAGGPALYLDDVSDPALTPAYESLAIPPFTRSQLTIVTWLGSTATTEDFKVEVANPVEAVRTLGIASKWPDLMEKGDGPIIVSGSIPKRAVGVADWNALMDATRFAVKVRWTSTAIIATTYPYKAWLECDGAQYVDGGPEGLANKRRIGASYDWKATYDGVGASSTWTVVNNVASYA